MACFRRILCPVPRHNALFEFFLHFHMLKTFNLHANYAFFIFELPKIYLKMTFFIHIEHMLISKTYTGWSKLIKITLVNS